MYTLSIIDMTYFFSKTIEKPSQFYTPSIMSGYSNIYNSISNVTHFLKFANSSTL